VFEMGGVFANKGTIRRWVVVKELEDGIGINMESPCIMAVEDARSLARQLYRMARRHERRAAG